MFAGLLLLILLIISFSIELTLQENSAKKAYSVFLRTCQDLKEDSIHVTYAEMYSKKGCCIINVNFFKRFLQPLRQGPGNYTRPKKRVVWLDGSRWEELSDWLDQDERSSLIGWIKMRGDVWLVGSRWEKLSDWLDQDSCPPPDPGDKGQCHSTSDIAQYCRLVYSCFLLLLFLFV